MRSSSRFAPFAPTSLRTTGLRRLKTAFSPSSSISSSRSLAFGSGASTPHRSASSSSSTGTASPLSSHMGSPAMSHGDECETMEGLVVVPTTLPPPISLALSPGSYPVGAVCGTMDSVVMGGVEKRSSAPAGRIRALLARRRRQRSQWDTSLEEEQRVFASGLRVFEPRQKGEIAMGGIFEVLEGKW